MLPEETHTKSDLKTSFFFFDYRRFFRFKIHCYKMSMEILRNLIEDNNSELHRYYIYTVKEVTDTAHISCICAMQFRFCWHFS